MTNMDTIPRLDLHVHVEGETSIEDVLRLAEARGAKIGVVEHAGFGQAISNDEDLIRYVERLASFPVYKGIQAEGRDWPQAFSEEALTHLDFVLTDALTFPERDGRFVRLWTEEAQVEDKDDFMERYVDFGVRILTTEPIDIFANPTYLPECIAHEYDALWTEERMDRLIQAAAQAGVAIEINARYRIPSLRFVKRAREAGVKFSFGSNTHGREAGMLDYCLEVVRALGLTAEDLFVPRSG